MANTVLGGLFNAFAFSVSSFLFSKLNHSNYEREIRRHDKAVKNYRKQNRNGMRMRFPKRIELQNLENNWN